MTSAPTKKAAAAKTGARPARKTAAKAGAAKPAGEKPARAAVTKPTAGSTLRAPGLVARVAESTGAKLKDIRATVQATLNELGKALDAGETLVLPPLGKVSITPAKADGGKGPMKLKLRRGIGSGAKNKAEKEALAAPEEAS